jgi:hypothetical protein
MKLLTRAITLSATLMATAAVTTQSASALTIEQTQELSNTAKTSVTCNGECSGSAEATQHGKQSQKIEMQTPVMHTAKPVKYNYRAGKVVYVPSTVVMMADGHVRLSWGMRGGTCHVRYTESNQNVWKYNTSAGCDEGGTTIGGLQSGVKYKFQVRQDNGAWSRTMVGTAR